MRPIITVSAVVLLHLCVVAVLVSLNGCRSTSGFEQDGDLAAYSAGARPVGSSATRFAPATPAAPTTTPAPVPTDRISTPAPTKVTPATAVGPGGTYVVKPNDSLFVIAAREKVSASALAAANGLQLNAVLRVGQKLKIPAPGSNAKNLAPKSSATGKAASANTGAVDNGPTFSPVKLVPLTGNGAAPADAAATPAK